MLLAVFLLVSYFVTGFPPELDKCGIETKLQGMKKKKFKSVNLLIIIHLKNLLDWGTYGENMIYMLVSELCLKNLNSLASFNLITMDEDINIKPTGYW